MDEETQKRVNLLVKTNTKTELQKMCKEKNKSMSGTKIDMAQRVLGIVVQKAVSSSIEEGGSTATAGKKKDAFSVVTPNSNLILRIAKNKFGHYTHEETSMVFDPITKRVIGVQLPSGSVRSLQRVDIDTCQKYKFQYNLPNMLDPSPIYEVLENSDNDGGNKSDADLSDEEEDDDMEGEEGNHDNDDDM
jgi:hypothetical protein